MMRNLVCPVSTLRVDRNAVRVTGLLSTLALVAYVVTRSPFVIVPLGLDYLVRTVMAAPPSPLAQLGRTIARLLRLPAQPIDKAPKVFAARIGVCFALAAAVTHFLAPAAAPCLAGTLAVFTLLEGGFDFCVGCVVYTYVALPLWGPRDAA